MQEIPLSACRIKQDRGTIHAVPDPTGLHCNYCADYTRAAQWIVTSVSSSGFIKIMCCKCGRSTTVGHISGVSWVMRIRSSALDRLKKLMADTAAPEAAQ